MARNCTRAIWIDKGTVRGDGPTEEVLAAYTAAAIAPPIALVTPPAASPTAP